MAAAGSQHTHIHTVRRMLQAFRRPFPGPRPHKPPRFLLGCSALSPSRWTQRETKAPAGFPQLNGLEKAECIH